jgi:hypothetical protein
MTRVRVPERIHQQRKTARTYRSPSLFLLFSRESTASFIAFSAEMLGRLRLGGRNTVGIIGCSWLFPCCSC